MPGYDNPKDGASGSKEQNNGGLGGSSGPSNEDRGQVLRYDSGSSTQGRDPRGPDTDASVLYSPDKFSVYDIDTFTNILTFIELLFDYLYKIIPQTDNEELFKKANRESNSKNLMNFYFRIRNFIHAVVYNKEKLDSNFKFVERKAETMIASLEGMLVFYSLNRKFNKMKDEARRFAADEGAKINSYLQEINELSQRFITEVSDVKKGAYALRTLDEYLDSQLEVLSQNGYTDGLTSSMDKFDKVVMFVVRMIEIKLDIEKQLLELKKSMGQLKEIRIDLEKQILDFDKFIGDQIIKQERERLKNFAIRPDTLFIAVVLFILGF